MKFAITTITLLHIFFVTSSQEVNQWRGPERTGIYTESSLLKTWEGNGPHWSHPVIYKGILYIRYTDVLMAFNIKEK